MQDFSNVTLDLKNEYNGEFSIFFKTPRDFDFLDSLWCWGSLLLGYIFCRAFPAVSKPLYSLIFIVLLYASTLVMLILKKAKFGKAAICIGVSGLFVSLSLFLSGNSVIHTFAFGYGIFAYCYFVSAATENRLEGGVSSYILIDFLKAVFVIPFSGAGGIISAMFSKKNNKFGSILGKVILGVIIPIVPTAIVFSLLSFDSEFLNLFGNIFNFNLENIVGQVVSIILAFPMGAYIFRLFVSSCDKSAKGVVTAKECKKASERAAIVPIITLFSATIPLLFIYVIFFISQWKYYVSGFLGELPENLNYATYAREGFFQLLAVSAINLAIIAAIGLFAKKKSGFGKFSVKILNAVVSIFTLILISTAVSKLVLYIDEHGLTPKRVHAFWFMMVLTLIFIAVFLKQFMAKIKLIPISLAIVVIMFFSLGVSGSDGFIAKYNVDRYLNGSLDKIIISDLEKLGDAAVPQYVRLEKELKEREKTLLSGDYFEYLQNNDSARIVELEAALNDYTHKIFSEYSRKPKYNWYEITLPKILATRAIRERTENNG